MKETFSFNFQCSEVKVDEKAELVNKHLKNILQTNNPRIVMDWFVAIAYIAIPYCIYIYLGSTEGSRSKFTPCLHYSGLALWECFQNTTGIESKESPCSDNLMDFDLFILISAMFCYLFISFSFVFFDVFWPIFLYCKPKTKK